MKKKIVSGWKILSVFLAFVIVAGAITGLVFWKRGNIEFHPIEQEQASEERNGGVIIGESEGENMEVKSMRIAPENYAAYGVSAMAETAYTLTATVIPDNEAENTGIAWSVAWANAASEWATDKTVTEYVTITPQGETAALSKKATVECLQEFAEQIIITATSVDNGEAFATCTVDYAQKIKGITLKFGDINVNLGGETSITWEVNSSGTGMGGAVAVDYTLSDVYTVTDTFDYTVTLDKDDWNLTYKMGGQTVPVSAMISNADITDGSMVFDNAMFATYSMRYTWMTYDISLSNQGAAEVYTNMNTAISNGTADLFGVTVTVTGTYGELSQRSLLVLGNVTNTSTITDVTLDEDGIVF